VQIHRSFVHLRTRQTHVAPDPIEFYGVHQSVHQEIREALGGILWMVSGLPFGPWASPRRCVISYKTYHENTSTTRWEDSLVYSSYSKTIRLWQTQSYMRLEASRSRASFQISSIVIPPQKFSNKRLSIHNSQSRWFLAWIFRDIQRYQAKKSRDQST
jgi:hypothetical protein